MIIVVTLNLYAIIAAVRSGITDDLLCLTGLEFQKSHTYIIIYPIFASYLFAHT